MRRLSIKARVTLWYTALLLLLLALAAAYLVSFSDRLTHRQLRDTLLDAVAEAVQNTRFDHGELEDQDIDFYQNGVSIFLYDTRGRLLAPRVNRGIQVDAVLEDQSIKTARDGNERWLIHDLYAEQDGTGFWVRGMVSISGSQATLQRLLLLALFGVPVFVLIAAVGGWQLTRRAFAPVAAMAETANAITSGSDLSLRVADDGSGDELSRLGATVNSMLRRLQLSFETERQFTSDVSHELRTPTAVIQSQCEFALSQAAVEADRLDALRAILRQTQRISSITSQLLLLSRADNGRFSPSWEPISLGELCETVALEHQEAARLAEVALVTELSPGVEITGDETLLIRLLDNLLANAIAYNVAGGSVQLRLEPASDGCLLTVSDTGVGIAPQEQEKIWRRFYRVDASRNQAGSGLGLAMVEWIVRLHGGQLWLESAPGRGSSFFVQLPDEPKNSSPL